MFCHRRATLLPMLLNISSGMGTSSTVSSPSSLSKFGQSFLMVWSTNIYVKKGREMKESERGKKGRDPKRTPSFSSWLCFNGAGAFENGRALQLQKAPWPKALLARSCRAGTIIGYTITFILGTPASLIPVQTGRWKVISTFFSLQSQPHT